jgi:hypothetical protein
MFNRQAISLILVGTTVATAAGGILSRQDSSLAQSQPDFDYAEQECPFPDLSSSSGEETKPILSPKYGIEFSIPEDFTVVPGDRGIEIIREEMATHIRCQERLTALGWPVPGRGIATISIYQVEGTPTSERLKEIVSQPSPMQIETTETIERGTLTGYLGYGNGGATLALETPNTNQPVVINQWCDCNGYDYSQSTLKKIVTSLEPFARK